MCWCVRVYVKGQHKSTQNLYLDSIQFHSVSLYFQLTRSHFPHCRVAINSGWAMVLMRNCSNLVRTWNEHANWIQWILSWFRRRLIAVAHSLSLWHNECNFHEKNTCQPQLLSKLVLVFFTIYTIRVVETNWNPDALHLNGDSDGVGCVLTSDIGIAINFCTSGMSQIVN